MDISKDSELLDIMKKSGFISGFDGDTPVSVKAMARKLYEIGVDVPFLSILTPFRGTVAYRKMVKCMIWSQMTNHHSLAKKGVSPCIAAP